jgi:hypothetical protein
MVKWVEILRDKAMLLYVNPENLFSCPLSDSETGPNSREKANENLI